MKRMLINATQEEELRMAMVDGQNLYDLNIELPESERTKANIYKGQITRIEPSLEAAFVNYGAERHGFLPLKEISSEYFVADGGSGKPNIKQVLREGQDIVVQVDKEERGNKGAALTTYVSLAGRFIVLKPNKDRSGGVSRRIMGEDRDLARKSLRDVEVPENMSVILRTAGIERTAEELTWDMENLLAVWEAIKKVVVARTSPFLIYRESSSVVRALRDYLTNEIGEILIDDEATYKEAKEFVEQVMPHNLRKLKHYTDQVPLFTRYQIDSQIESAFAHSVNLPSGGSVVIDHTEALISIDINSARATKGSDIEATALNTNLEAADEVARQLRLRDLGGLVVIDFIDMGPQKNQRDVENRLREAVRQDRARVQLSKISRFGLLEMSRQRMRPSLGESSHLVCPRCAGIGNIRNVESIALAILRIIGEEARKERTTKVIAQLPIEVATYLLNEKRDWVQSLESRHDTQVILVANPALETPHYQVRRVRDDQVDLPENVGNSFMLAESDDEPEITQTMEDKKPAEIAAVTTVVATTPAPLRQEPVVSSASTTASGPGLFSRIAGFFAGSPEDEKPQKKPTENKRGRSQSDSRRRGGQRNKTRSDSQRQGNKGQSRQNQQSAKKRGKKTGDKDNERSKAQNQGAQETKRDENAQDNQSDGRQTSKKRRSRGGRRRRRGPDTAENSDNVENVENQNSDTQQAEASTEPKETSNRQAEKKPARKPRQPRPKADNVEQADSSETANAPATDENAKPEAPKRKPRSRTPAAKREQQSDAPTAKPEQQSDAPGGEKSASTSKTVDSKPAAAPKLTQIQTKKPAEAKKTEDKPVVEKPPVKVVEDAAPKKAATEKPALTHVASKKPALTQVAPKKPAPARRKAPASSSHEDTQPELTIIKETAAPKVKQPTVSEPKETAAPKAVPTPKPRPAPPKAVESGNSEPKPVSKPTAVPDPKPVAPAKSVQDEKPAAKLLPWDTDGGSPGDKN
ncbi:MAG: Rne/Rng family ribonuclease [Woeseiaceae bacterium]|nr:Rne/Rng family ribonuclease [Woeseiaceae bacterium]